MSYPTQPQAQYQQPGYMPQQPSMPTNAGYPDLSQGSNFPGSSQPQQPAQSTGQQNAWPTAPSFNPNWSDDKKNV